MEYMINLDCSLHDFTVEVSTEPKNTEDNGGTKKRARRETEKGALFKQEMAKQVKISPPKVREKRKTIKKISYVEEETEFEAVTAEITDGPTTSPVTTSSVKFEKMFPSLLAPSVYTTSMMKCESTVVTNFKPRQFGDDTLYYQSRNKGGNEEVSEFFLPFSTDLPETGCSLSSLSANSVSDQSESQAEFSTPLPYPQILLPGFETLKQFFNQHFESTSESNSLVPISADDVEKDPSDHYRTPALEWELDIFDPDHKVRSFDYCTMMIHALEDETKEANRPNKIQTTGEKHSETTVEKYSAARMLEYPFQAAMTKCRFCSMTFYCDQLKKSHEESCVHQPIQCPSINCVWFNQLASLTTHIFNHHTVEVVMKSEASFSVDLGNDTGYNSIADGPKHMTFFQFVQQRLFVTHITVNFQTSQLCVYVQYVDDGLSFKSWAAVELLRSDGKPIQWKGELHPMSYNSMHLITRQQCLVGTMATFQNLCVHVKVCNNYTPNQNGA